MPYSLTFEVYGGVGDWRQCFRYFNPTTAHEFHHAVHRWSITLLDSMATVLWRLR